MNRKLKTAAVLAALALPVLTYAAHAAYLRVGRDPAQADALVGWAEARIRTTYGRPVEDRPGYHPLALNAPPALPPGPCVLVPTPR